MSGSSNFLAVIDDTTFSTGGEDDNVYLDVLTDSMQRLDGTAKGMIVKNKSGAAQVIYIQIAGLDGKWCSKISVEKGGDLVIPPEMGLDIAQIKMWGSAASTIGQVLLFKGR